MKALAIVLLIDTVLTVVFAILGYRPPTNAFVGASFLETAALMIGGASMALYREQYLREGLQMIFVGFLLFLIGGAVDWLGFWLGI